MLNFMNLNEVMKLLFYFWDHSIFYVFSVTLNNIIQRNFPEEYAERKAENDSLINLGVDLLPLFVMDVVLPCQKFHLNIFEPRYRLMVSAVFQDFYLKIFY